MQFVTFININHLLLECPQEEGNSKWINLS